MSRYVLLVIINLPLITIGILNATVSYKLGKTNRKHYIFRLIMWLGILSGLIFAEPIYNFLFSKGLTQTEPLSLFDVIQITGIIIVFFIATQAYTRVSNLEKQLRDLHQELSIRISKEEK